MMRRETDSRSFCPCIMRENLARFVFSQSCSWFCFVVSRRLPIIWLMFVLSSSSSPCASTVICRVRSPLVTDVATSAMLRTCMSSVARRDFSFGADLARHARHFVGEDPEPVDHRVDGVLQLGHLAADL